MNNDEHAAKNVEGNWGHKIKLHQQPLPISIRQFRSIESSSIMALIGNWCISLHQLHLGIPKILLENYLPRYEGTGKTWKSMTCFLNPDQSFYPQISMREFSLPGKQNMQLMESCSVMLNYYVCDLGALFK